MGGRRRVRHQADIRREMLVHDVRVGITVNQRLRRLGMGREHVALGRDVAQARAQGQDQIAGIEGRDLRGGRRQVQVPSVQRMRVGKEVVLPERHRHRNRMPLGQPAPRRAPTRVRG
ncbi:hypothetical protein G6F58_013322 [Rhizopus delemar]|nr:hypothetical protein G6F58_013322 [Rhizopus delemar]